MLRVESLYHYALHNDWFPSASTTRLEQLRVSVGPPPLAVPRKVTVMSCDIVFGLGTESWCEYILGESQRGVRETARDLYDEQSRRAGDMEEQALPFR